MLPIRINKKGVALFVVFLMIFSLTALAYMALYTSTIERDIERAYRVKRLAASASEAGVHAVIRQLVSSPLPVTTPIPFNIGTIGTSPGQVQNHPIIGYCQVVAMNCLDPGVNPSNATVNEMCCFRTGPMANYSTGMPFKFTNPLDATEQALTKIHQDRDMQIPGSDNRWVHKVYFFFVTGAGPSRSFSESVVYYKFGPVQSGTSNYM
ncbi:MAG: hypothetical protein N2746_00985 [Deltaproteobacteria bacterium]|nr:hypothetical protein [Deltaproteobacteria bacterium]